MYCCDHNCRFLWEQTMCAGDAVHENYASVVIEPTNGDNAPQVPACTGKSPSRIRNTAVGSLSPGHQCRGCRGCRVSTPPPLLPALVTSELLWRHIGQRGGRRLELDWAWAAPPLVPLSVAVSLQAASSRHLE